MTGCAPSGRGGGVHCPWGAGGGEEEVYAKCLKLLQTPRHTHAMRFLRSYSHCYFVNKILTLGFILLEKKFFLRERETVTSYLP